jgi:hypothetical protein
VALKLRSAEDATQTIEHLLLESPRDSYLQVARALLRIRGSDRVAAISELRTVAEQHENDAYVHQALAGLLGYDKATWSEAWEHWKIALQAGPLLSPAYTYAAYYLAGKIDPKLAVSTLDGLSRIHRLAVRTRALSFRYLFDVFVVLLVLGALIGAKSLGVGVALGILAMAGGLWCGYTNFYIGCWKCLTVWITASVVMWPGFVYILKQPLVGFFFLIFFLLGSLVPWSKAKTIVLPHERLSAELERRSTK